MNTVDTVCNRGISVAADLHAKRKIVKKVPKGTSEYQAAWIIDSDEEVCLTDLSFYEVQ